MNKIVSLRGYSRDSPGFTFSEYGYKFHSMRQAGTGIGIERDCRAGVAGSAVYGG